MAITFNNIPNTLRTPGVYVELDNSRSQKGLLQNPHRALILGVGTSEATVLFDTIQAIYRDGLAEGFFGKGSPLARMCNAFRAANPNTELQAMMIGSGIAGTAATYSVNFVTAFSAGTTSMATDAVLYMLVNGTPLYTTLEAGWSVEDACSAVKAGVNNAASVYGIPFTASMAANDSIVTMSARFSGTAGNHLDVRFNYYARQDYPADFADSVRVRVVAAGATDPDPDDAWAVLENESFNYVIHPWPVTAQLTSIETELEDRADADRDQMGHAVTCAKDTHANLITLGAGRNSPYSTIFGIEDTPTDPAEIAATAGAVMAKNLNLDPARPLHFLALRDVLPPPQQSRFSRSERDLQLYGGIATLITDAGGRVCIERAITTYRVNALGLSDASYLDVQTLFTLAEIRWQYRARMANRFLIPRFKLADDTFPVQPGQMVATPRTVRTEIIALFAELQSQGLIENLAEFIDNLVVERDASDVNRVNVLLPPDLMNAFRILAGRIEFIL